MRARSGGLVERLGLEEVFVGRDAGGQGLEGDLLHGTPRVEDAGGDGAGIALPPDEERALNWLRMAKTSRRSWIDSFSAETMSGPTFA